MDDIGQKGTESKDLCIWIALCSIAVAGALYTSSNIWNRYQTSPTMTVLQSTNFPIENLPFPAITICNLHHVRWDKAILFQEKYLSDADNLTVDAFFRLVSALSVVNFGDFDMIGTYFGNSTEDAERLADLNITFLMMEVISSCDELFVEQCWWRNLDYDCCSLFELQKTEYGFCYSFNSETSQYRRPRRGVPQEKCREGDQHCNQNKCSDDDPGCKKADIRPRRTSTAGMWSGLRTKVQTFPQHTPPLSAGENAAGILVFVTSPYDLPLLGTDVTSGSTAQVSLSAQVTYTTPQVHDLCTERRGCIYENETEALGFPYRHGNCIAQCHRHSTYLYCNCTPYFFPTEDVYNYEKPEKDNPFFDDGQQGMVCKCQADCDRIEYTSEFYVTQGVIVSVTRYMATVGTNHTVPLYRGLSGAEDQVLLDIHFKHPTVVLYRTDVVFGWLDLTVSLGGVAGLFIGFSLLSGVELIYYLTFRLYGLWRAERRSKIAPKLKTKQPSHQNVFRSRKLHDMHKSLQKIQRVHPHQCY
ncbi:pickpocket protein 19 [Cryptotermes secundus]|uniref:pickpocket protein 19 n=1 Tax=Cryptotermes secundus TaxID=105785 RepID=UPI000CD7C0BA|nr:pickpocket protein 19 [Cryptotermes secundus]